MQDVLKITMTGTKGEFVRVLALIERRQFVIRSIRTEVGHGPDMTTLHVAVTSVQRNISSLAKRIDELEPVQSVEFASGETL